jgi:gp16 family phage-associated protein
VAQRKLTDEERRARARAKFSRTGYSINKWARDWGVNPKLVTEVLAGRRKGVRGQAHKIAVALGIKDGVIVPEGTDPLTAIRMADEVRS